MEVAVVRLTTRWLALCAFGLVAAPSLASETAEEPQAAAPAAEPDKGNGLICRRDRVTGSLTKSVRICQTREEWERQGREAREITQRALERTRIPTR
jgi:hypothetical protein